MSNRNRTSKPERREARRRNPMMCAAIGTAATARLRRTVEFTTDAGAVDRLTEVMRNHDDPMPLELNARVAEALTWSRQKIALALDVPVEDITPTADVILVSEPWRPVDPDYARLFVDDGWAVVGTVASAEFEPWHSTEVEAVAPTGAPPAPDLRGAGTLTFPASLEIPDGCREPELHNALAAFLAEDLPDDAAPAIVLVSTCIECGDEFEGTGDICSAGCGYSLTGDAPPAYEKDYGDE